MTASPHSAPRPTAPLRLLFVIDSLGSGGAQRQMVAVARGLAARGHRPTFWVYQPQYAYFADELARAGIDVHVAEKGSRFSPGPLLALRRMLRQQEFDAVLAFLATPSVYAELATRYPGHPPLVVSERSTFEEDPPRLSVRVRTQLHRFADVVVANSHHHRLSVQRHFPWLTPRLRTIWNGVDLERFHPADDWAPDGELVAVGSIRWWKNLQGLARALVILQERGVPVPRVRWAGKLEPTAASRAEYDAVNRILGDAGLADRWEWLGEYADVPGLLRTHAALVHPSFLEGLPNAVCEALASGVPVLAGAIGDQPQLVEPGITGFRFDPDDPATIASAIERFGALPAQQRRAMGAAARRFAEARLSLARACDEYEAMLQSLVAGRRRPRPPASGPSRASNPPGSR